MSVRGGNTSGRVPPVLIPPCLPVSHRFAENSLQSVQPTASSLDDSQPAQASQREHLRRGADHPNACEQRCVPTMSLSPGALGEARALAVVGGPCLAWLVLLLLGRSPGTLNSRAKAQPK